MLLIIYPGIIDFQYLKNFRNEPDDFILILLKMCMLIFHTIELFFQVRVWVQILGRKLCIGSSQKVKAS